MTGPRRTRQSPRRYGEDDDVARQSITGIGIVAATSLALALTGFLIAVVVSWMF